MATAGSSLSAAASSPNSEEKVNEDEVHPGWDGESRDKSGNITSHNTVWSADD